VVVANLGYREERLITGFAISMTVEERCDECQPWFSEEVLVAGRIQTMNGIIH
jgi:hypothetical protein